MIVGFSIDSMNAEKHSGKRGNINVNYRSRIDDVEAAEVAAIDEPVARITFTLDAAYRHDDESVADMNFEGSLLWQGDADEIVEQWQDDDALDEDIRAAITNHIYRKCLTQAVFLSDTLDLPSPVPMPRVQNQ